MVSTQRKERNTNGGENYFISFFGGGGSLEADAERLRTAEVRADDAESDDGILVKLYTVLDEISARRLAFL